MRAQPLSPPHTHRPIVAAAPGLARRSDLQHPVGCVVWVCHHAHVGGVFRVALEQEQEEGRKQQPSARVKNGTGGLMQGAKRTGAQGRRQHARRANAQGTALNRWASRALETHRALHRHRALQTHRALHLTGGRAGQAPDCTEQAGRHQQAPDCRARASPDCSAGVPVQTAQSRQAGRHKHRRQENRTHLELVVAPAGLRACKGQAGGVEGGGSASAWMMHASEQRGGWVRVEDGQDRERDTTACLQEENCARRVA
jgi:hypothetical protein